MTLKEHNILGYTQIYFFCIRILSVEIKEAYNYSKGDDFFTFCIFEDGSVTKTDAATDDEVGSSLEEMEQLESDGYEIEDVTDEYTF